MILCVSVRARVRVMRSLRGRLRVYTFTGKNKRREIDDSTIITIFCHRSLVDSQTNHLIRRWSHCISKLLKNMHAVVREYICDIVKQSKQASKQASEIPRSSYCCFEVTILSVKCSFSWWKFCNRYLLVSEWSFFKLILNVFNWSRDGKSLSATPRSFSLRKILHGATFSSCNMPRVISRDCVLIPEICGRKSSTGRVWNPRSSATNMLFFSSQRHRLC